MSEINAIPWNGMKVASTFSGCGGSCLGYRMAGFKVVWANEFVPIAQESYRANMAHGCILDPRDIRTIQPEEVLEATDLQVGELDLFDGSPPCQAFSTAGKREKGWGKGKRYEHGAVQKNEELFSEYIRILRGLRPRAFVAENVSGLVKGTAKGYFLEILKGLKESGYRVRCKVLDAKWLGVPQSRQRAIFIGIREDLGAEPVHPKPLPYFYSVRDALPWITRVATKNDRYDESTVPAPTILASDGRRCSSTQGGANLGMVEALSNRSMKEVWCGDYRMVTAGNERHIEALRRPSWSANSDPSPTITATEPRYNLFRGTERRKFTIDELKRICAFPDDFVLKGSYSQQWERLGNSVPPVMMMHIAMGVADVLISRGR